MQVTLPIASERPKVALPRELINWILCWVVLPNAAFCAIWVIGAPPRHPEIVAVGVVGLLVRKASFPVKYAAFVAALFYAVVSYISALFNLAIASLIPSIGFMLELRPAASIEYVALAVMLVLTLGAAWIMLKRRTDFEVTWQVVCAVALILTLASVDKWMSRGNRGSYKRIAPAGAPFSSATEQTGLLRIADGKNNLLVVVVEAMGFPQDAELQAKLFRRWRQPDIAARYTIVRGTTPYYGSTTNGEIRELCGRWDEYANLMEGTHSECLPARLVAKGYRTTAVHSFDGAFFDRTTWYPKIGFQSFLFREELVRQGADACPGVFPGACDRDVPPILARQLKRTDGKQFVYWLTVNSHLPVPIDAALRTDECNRFDAKLAEEHAMTCRLFRLWSEIDVNLAAVLTDPTLPPTDVLIVGDHMPPFFDREERSLFHPEQVPWILLRHKGTVAPPPAITTAAANPGSTNNS